MGNFCHFFSYVCYTFSPQSIFSPLDMYVCVQVFDDVAVELAMALLQFFNNSPPEEQVFRTLKALARYKSKYVVK